MSIRVLEGPCLAERTTLRLGGRCLAEVRVTALEDLERLPDVLAGVGGDPRIMGWGSNILAREGSLPLAVVTPDIRTGPAIVSQEQDRVVVRVGAGVRLPRLLGWCAGKGASGLEGLAGIPGTLGGAVAMNAGSYGVDIRAVLVRARLFTPETGLAWFGAQDLDFDYRRFGLRRETSFLVVAEAEFGLVPSDRGSISQAMQAHYARKKAGQPILAHSAGCVFKNPAPDAPAGKLLDEAGLKGKRLGGMGFSELHANFLINHGGGTSQEALELLAEAQRVVRDKAGHALELEVQVWPWP